MMNKKKNNSLMILAVLTLGLVFSAAMFTSVRASNDQPLSMFSAYDESDEDDDDDDDDGIHDDDESSNKREIQIEVSADEAHIESSIDNGEVENEFSIELHAESDKLALNFEFSNEINDTENELEFDIEFLELIRFNDTGISDNSFNDSIDQVIDVYEIGGFLPIEYTFENNTDGETHILHVETTDGVFGINVYVSNEFVLINDTILTPTEAKIDIIISDYNIDNATNLALKIEFEIEAEVELEYDEETEDEEYELASDELEIEFNMSNYLGFFSWSEIALVDGVEQPVLASPFEADDFEHKLYLNYPLGDLIIHDPKVGVMNVLQLNLITPNISLSLYTIGGISLLIALGITMLAVRKIKWRK
ncbi:MAG: hypothetical protein ACTSQB_01995, partial [Candidatus Heimdallarchaeota archaeon]